MVSYIPLPVVAGYLAYVGYFCIAAGMAQGTSLSISGPETWPTLFENPSAWPQAAVTAALAAGVFVALRVCSSAAALPAVLTAVPILWYVMLGVVTWWSGHTWSHTVHWLADHNWTAEVPESDGQPLWEVWSRAKPCWQHARSMLAADVTVLLSILHHTGSAMAKLQHRHCQVSEACAARLVPNVKCRMPSVFKPTCDCRCTSCTTWCHSPGTTLAGWLWHTSCPPCWSFALCAALA